MTHEWETLPSVDYDDRTQWRDLGGGRFAAIRVRLLLVCTQGKGSRLGPVIEEHNVSPGDRVTLRRKHETVVSRTNTITEAIRSAAKERLCDKLSAQVSSELSSKVPGFSGKVSVQSLSQSEIELTHELERSLSRTVSYSIQETEGREHEIVIDGEAGARVAQLRRRYRPRHWTVYAHSMDYLELSYRRTWPWRKVRQTMKQVSSPLGWPLASLTFYEPQRDLVLWYGDLPDELENPEAFEFPAPIAAMPAAQPPRQELLTSLAQIAFPVSREEKSRAAARKKSQAAHAFALAGDTAGKKRGTPTAKAKKKSAARKRTRRPPAVKRKSRPAKARKRAPRKVSRRHR